MPRFMADVPKPSPAPPVDECAMKLTLLPLVAGTALTAAATAAMPVSAAFDYTFATRYVTHGFNVGDTQAHQSSVSLTSNRLPGFKFTYWNSLTHDRGLKANDEHDFILHYNRTFREGDAWEVAFTSYIDYWWYPNNTVKGDDLQGMKYHVGGSLPNLIPMPEGYNLVPGYNYYHWHDIHGAQFPSGAVHEFLLRSDIPICISDAAWVPQSIGVKTTLNYNTGFLGVDSGFSHVTAHLYTGAPINRFLSWHVSADYQWTLDGSLNGNGDNIFWGTIGLTASF